MRLQHAAVLIGLLVPGCSCSGTSAPPALVDTGVVSAKRLQRIEPEFHQSGWDDRPDVIFGVDEVAQWDYQPVILVSTKRGWKLFEMPGDASGRRWVHAASVDLGEHLFAISELTIESPGWSLEVVASHDGGRTWEHTSTVDKPNYQALFHGFSMDANGHGQLVVYLEDQGLGDPQGMAGRAHRLLRPKDFPPRPGNYVYTTRDGGRTWSKPKYVPNAAVEVYSVGSDTSLEDVLRWATQVPTPTPTGP